MDTPILIVDGYNIIGAWDDLKDMKKNDMGSAREQLVSILAGYRSWCWERIIVVFDGQSFAWEDVDGIEIVFTGSRETADTMIERLAAGLATNYQVEVATSDFAENRAASALGAKVYSASALKECLAEKQKSYRRLTGSNKKDGMMLNDFLNKSVIDSLEKLRRS